jgi:ATP:ADP antiporter, AAA family
MANGRQTELPVHAAALSAAALIAHQVGGKAMRDALFLSHFDVTSLAWMVIAASILSILLGIGAAKLMASFTPSKVVPRAFLVSAFLLLAQWGISRWSDAVVAVLVYLQVAALGSALISGFWSLLGDRFDPHTARKQYGRVIAAGTFGGMVGGLLAERIGTSLGVTAMLPVLAALDLICAFLTNTELNDRERSREIRRDRSLSLNSSNNGFRALQRERYLRDLALLVVLTTVGAGLLDYVFKARAVAAHSNGADLVRFFAIFYTATGVLTFLVQIALSRLSLEKFGLAGTIGSLPSAVAVGSIGGILVPGLGAAAVARGSESIFRSSFFRSGYELFFAAVPVRQRREIKPILDVGFERIGDIVGGLLISILLLAGSTIAMPVMLIVAAVTGVIGLWISRRLHHGYVKALESNLMNQSIHIDISDIRDSTTRAVMQTMSKPIAPPERIEEATEIVVPDSLAIDPVVARVAALRSSDPDAVRRALSEPLDATMAAHVISLLAWNAVSDDAVRALQDIAPSITGQLIDALIDPSQEFAVRRRIPRVLSVIDSKRAFDGLAQGLFDNRFEVRFQAGRALAQIQDRVRNIAVDQSLIVDAVQRELSVDKEVWDTRSVIDTGEEQEIPEISSEHVFRLLSLILPRDPLKVAYRGLHAGDDRVKGMAVEYLESVLPAELRSVLARLIVR